MNLLFRIMLAVYGFCLTIISFLAIILTLNHDLLDSIYRYLRIDVLGNKLATFVFFFLALVFLVLSLTFLLSGFRMGKDKKAVSKHTNIGEIKITLNSIENIALNTARRINGIRDIRAGVSKSNDTVSITLKAVVMSDICIPDLSAGLQLQVKKAVEETAGIAVSHVKVVVDGIYSSIRPKVE